MTNKIYCLVIFLVTNMLYSSQEIPSFDEFEVYTQDKDNKILIIPFENKMYASAVDNEIAEYNGMNYIDVKEELKKGISSQILLKISNKTPAISMVHHKDSVSEVLNYIYNNIGLKYEKVKTKDTVQTPPSKTELIKDKLKKFVVQTNQHHEKAKYDRGKIKNGEIYTSNYSAERFMNVIIQNPNLLEKLNNKYKTNYYIFINEFHIGRAYPSKENRYLTNRKISTHYTVFNQRGRELDAGLIKVEMPGDVFGIQKIEHEYLSVIASELCSFMPNSKLNKATIIKEAEDDKNSKKQRKIIHGVLEQ
jgi:hypothetical protein